jgi:hypothetical protein
MSVTARGSLTAAWVDDITARASEPGTALARLREFEFVLVPFWQIGLAVAAVGGLFLLVSRRLKNAA